MKAKWNTKLFEFQMEFEHTVGDLKYKLFELTQVEPKRQKLLGLLKGKLVLDDDQSLGDLLNPPKGGTEERSHLEVSFRLMGTPEKDIFVFDETAAAAGSADSMPDLDEIAPSTSNELVERYQQELQKISQNLSSLHIMHPLREGKKLLILDLDYTLMNTRGQADQVSQLARPGLHDFLTAMYEFYDLVIWSQTSWRYLEAKITSLGMLSRLDDYRISFVLDRGSMISVERIRERSSGGKVTVKHQVKPLKVIWDAMPDRYGRHNTLHIDDLGRNVSILSCLMMSLIILHASVRIEPREWHQDKWVQEQ